MLIDILLRLILQGELGCPDRMDFSCVKNLQGRVFLLNKQADFRASENDGFRTFLLQTGKDTAEFGA